MRLVSDVVLRVVQDIVLEVFASVEVLVDLVDFGDECPALLIGVSNSSETVP